MYIFYMRTTIRMEDQLLQEAKKRALAEHKSLTVFIQEAVQEKLAASPVKGEAAEAEPFYLITFQGGGTHPDIELDNSSALRDVMDE